jgi:branched-chain amino acid transport system substrate-binding protein
VRFRIGFAAPLTTPQAIVGVPMMRTVQLAVADARARGLDLELLAVDDRESEVIAANAAAELVADPSVIAVIGHKNSGPSGAAGPVYAQAGLAQITQCSTDNALSRAGWPTFFRLCADNERQASIAADLAYSLHRSGSTFAVHDGTDYGRPLVEAFATRLRALSSRAVVVMAMHVGQEDFTDVVDAIRAAHAGVVDIGATEIESSKLMRALRSAGVGAQFISSEGGPDNPIARLAGPAGDGSIHTYAGADPMATPRSRGLVQRCRNEFGETPSYVIECYDAVSVIVAALEKGAATRAQVRDAIAVTDLEGLGGRIRFDEHGDRIDAPVSLWQVVGGHMVALDGRAAPGG